MYCFVIIITFTSFIEKLKFIIKAIIIITIIIVIVIENNYSSDLHFMNFIRKLIF